MKKTVLSSLKDGVCTITLNRPERLNAINAQLVRELRSVLRGANSDPAVRAIVLRGAGRAFCSGDDLQEFEGHLGSKKKARAYIESIQAISREILFGDKIVVGAIHGWAVGGGLEWLLDCDLNLFAEGTRCYFPETGFGFFVGGAATALLPKLVGLRRARELILLGDKFDAAEAYEMGIASRVVPAAILFDEAQKLAVRIAGLPQTAVSSVKRILNRPSSLDAKNAMKLETEACVRGFMEPSTTQRVRKFLGRIRPHKDG